MPLFPAQVAAFEAQMFQTCQLLQEEAQNPLSLNKRLQMLDFNSSSPAESPCNTSYESRPQELDLFETCKASNHFSSSSHLHINQLVIQLFGKVLNHLSWTLINQLVIHPTHLDRGEATLDQPSLHPQVIQGHGKASQQLRQHQRGARGQ